MVIFKEVYRRKRYKKRLFRLEPVIQPDHFLNSPDLARLILPFAPSKNKE